MISPPPEKKQAPGGSPERLPLLQMPFKRFRAILIATGIQWWNWATRSLLYKDLAA